MRGILDGIGDAVAPRMDKLELQERTMRFAVEVQRLARLLITVPTGRGTASQLLNSSQSVASNYRAACRGRSRAEFIAKLGTVVEEADESVMWLEFVRDANLLTTPDVETLLDEAKQLRAIFAASLGTARRNHRRTR